ncbi:acyltransferase family protein [Silvanigrella paludirubra]|uniref:Acyltransferase family protein n=1 Tax=Silvanigrella paludirubra TaxID=2499159 RepID=A0A6N6VVV2_9BACT|nr:acyltransferase [Silvanigrella paludirubra]KAB8040720.1 acyltransferase family protein [Silvanigrella paludirubra]
MYNKEVKDIKISQRISGIDSLRGIAAIIMALFHANSAFGLNFNVPNFRLDIFFILSGIIMALVYEDKIYSGKINFKDYFVKRISRLLPLHYITLFLTLILFILYIISGKSYLVPPESNIFTFFLHLFLLQNIGLTETLTWNYVSWSISAQIIIETIWFYFLYKKNKSSYLYLFVIIICMFIIIKSFGLGFVDVASNPSIIYINAGMLRYLMDFCIGVLIYRFFCVRFKMFYMIPNYILNVISLIIMIYLITIWTFKNLYFEGSDFVNALFVYPLLICICINNKTILSKIINTYFLSYLGKIAYSIFLIHPLIIVLSWKIQKYFDFHWILLLCLYYFILIVASHLSYNFIEIPGARLVNKIFEKVKKRKNYVIKINN